MKTGLCILGDICPAWGFPKGSPADSLFHNTADIIKNSSFTVANLESPATNNTQKIVKNSICLKAEPNALFILKEAGIQAVALANNHILDYREDGLRETLVTAEKAGMLTYGAGSMADAAEPLMVTVDGKRVGFLAFAEQEFNCAEENRIGANRWDDLESPMRIRESKEKCDYLVVQYHGGIEEYIYPSPRLQKRCRIMVEMGADFVTCQHSHCVGTVEKYGNGEILYGQGNSIFGYRPGNEQWNTGLIVKIDFKEHPEITYIPIAATDKGEFLLEEDAAAAVLERFWSESQKISDEGFIKEQWQIFCRTRRDHYMPMILGWNRYLNKINRILKGLPVSMLVSRKSARNSMNLIRCDAHREVLTTILEQETGNESKTHQRDYHGAAEI